MTLCRDKWCSAKYILGVSCAQLLCDCQKSSAEKMFPSGQSAIHTQCHIISFQQLNGNLSDHSQCFQNLISSEQLSSTFSLSHIFSSHSSFSTYLHQSSCILQFTASTGDYILPRLSLATLYMFFLLSVLLNSPTNSFHIFSCVSATNSNMKHS